MITSIDEIQPSPFAINQIRVTVENLHSDLKYHLKKVGISESYYKEAVTYLKSHFKEYEEWLKKHEDELF